MSNNNMAEIQDINLHIDGQVFSVKKDVLCSHSDYFRAMFSGNYIETEERNITIDAFGIDSMNILLKYMDLGSLDLTEYTLQVLCKLSKAATFLQMTELLKQIEHCLEKQLTIANCMEILDTAEQCPFAKLEHLSAALGLLSIKSMEPKYIPTIDRLAWYLSHPYLDIDKEIDAFKFGFDWITQTETKGDALLIVLGCLDVKRLTCNDTYQMCLLIKEYKNSLAERVIKCLERLCMGRDITLDAVTTKRSILCERFTEQVYTETYNLVKDSKERKLKYTPLIQNMSSWEPPFMLYKYTEGKGLEDCLKLANNWSISAWGSTKLVLCGLHMKPDHDMFSRESYDMMNVMIYDTLRKEWTTHGVALPVIISASFAVLDDLLYIVGACEPGQPSTSPTSIVYNLKDQTYKRIADSPEGINILTICSHRGSLYAATIPKRLYLYESEKDTWRKLPTDKGLNANHKINSLISFNGYIYSWSGGHLIRRIRPEIDGSWQLVKSGREDISTIAMCSMRSHLIIFLERPTSCEESDTFLKDNENYKHRFIYDPQIRDTSIIDSCPLVLDLPSLRTEISEYLRRYLSELM